MMILYRKAFRTRVLYRLGFDGLKESVFINIVYVVFSYRMHKVGQENCSFQE